MYRNIPMLYRVLESFFRYRTLFLISAAIVTVIPGAYLMARPPAYVSTALIQVVVEDLSAALGDNNRNYTWMTVAQQNMNRFNDWMSDDSPGGFVDRALQKAHLARPINVDPRAKDPRLALLRKALSTNVVSESVFSITLIWNNATECENIARAFQSQYIERTGQDKQAASVAVVQFLDTELETYASRLRASEKAVIDFKRHNAGQAPEAQSATINQLSDMRIQLNNLEVTSHNNDLRREILQKRISHIKPTSIMEQHISNNPVRESPLVLQKNQLESKRSTLLADGWLLTSTRIQALDAQIKLLQQDIEAEIKADPAHAKNVTDTILQDNPEYRDLQSQLTTATIEENTEKAQVDQLRRRIADYEVRLAQLPDAEARMNDVMRDFNILKTQYEDLLRRREQARLKTSLDKVGATSTLHAIGLAYAEPTGGKTKTTIVLIGLLIFGLALGLTVAVLAEWADPSLRFAADIQRRLGVPALISLPELAPLRMITSSPGGEMSDGKPLLPARNE